MIENNNTKAIAREECLIRICIYGRFKRQEAFGYNCLQKCAVRVSGEYQGVVYCREVVYTALLSDLPPKCHYIKGKVIPLQARCGPEGG